MGNSAELEFKPIAHDHKVFLAKARTREGSTQACVAQALGYHIAVEVLNACNRSGVTEDGVTERMGTTKSVISCLKSASKDAPVGAVPQR